MPLNFFIKRHELEFKFEARTSRGSLHSRSVWYIKCVDTDEPENCGFGEAAPLAGLSIDAIPDFEVRLVEVLKRFEGLEVDDVFDQLSNGLEAFPAIRFALETALLDLKHGGRRMIYATDFYGGQPIAINGLIWMGAADLMQQRLEEKLVEGFDCIKLKIGALPFEEEYKILQQAREVANASTLELRVDANGAYAFEDATAILKRLATLGIHSIEQPIAAGQPKKMAQLCQSSPVPIALDEELIGVKNEQEKKDLLAVIKPQYIILKPTLVGGFEASVEWIDTAEAMGIGWWITSALESNIGLNAICQFVSQFETGLPQGLGTGGLYHNNIPSPLHVGAGEIAYDANGRWDLDILATGFTAISSI
jgi:O-succinylbenzoate synthase